MERTAKFLADYIIKKGTVEETDRKVYEYGFLVSMELGLFVLFCISMFLYLHMVIEGILFLVFFISLRSYAGGLHLNRFHSCFILSCLTVGSILIMVKNFCIPITATLPIFGVLVICVYVLYPIDHINRKTDSEENKYFTKRLQRFLIMHLAITAGFAILNYSRYLVLIDITYIVVVITMAIAKCKTCR